MAFATAIEAWDKKWGTDEGRADWLEPEPDVIALLPELKARGTRTALDLGCGVGRHALLLAEHGLVSKRSTAAPPVLQSRARPRKPGASRWVCDKATRMRCHLTTAVLISCCRGT